MPLTTSRAKTYCGIVVRLPLLDSTGLVLIWKQGKRRAAHSEALSQISGRQICPRADSL